MSEQLASLRQDIDEQDLAWLSALAKRFEITGQVGTLKAIEDLPAADPQRESAQFMRIEELAFELGVPTRLAHDILRLIIDEVVEQHLEIRNEIETSSEVSVE